MMGTISDEQWEKDKQAWARYCVTLVLFMVFMGIVAVGLVGYLLVRLALEVL